LILCTSTSQVIGWEDRPTMRRAMGTLNRTLSIYLTQRGWQKSR